jgi:hypothetical protein
MGGGGAMVYEGASDYSGGEAYWGSPYSAGPPQGQPGNDFYFQVLSTPENSVPEPASYAILSLGVLGLLAVKRYKTQRNP